MSEPTLGGRQDSGRLNRQHRSLTQFISPPTATLTNAIPFPFQFDDGFHRSMMISNQHYPLEEGFYHPGVMHQQYPAISSWGNCPQVLAQTQDIRMQMWPARGPNEMMPTLPRQPYMLNSYPYVNFAPSSQLSIQNHSSSPSSLPRHPAECSVPKTNRKTILPGIKPSSHKRTKKLRSREGNDDEEDEEPPHKVLFVERPALGGERRLAIKFDNLGELRYPLQTYGLQRWIVPHGIEGSHKSRNQDWWFRVTHDCDARSGATVLVFEVVNAASGLKVLRRETPEQAAIRQETGKTICNQVMLVALKERGLELHHTLETEPMDERRRSKVKDLVNKLIITRCSEGLLFFGLRHTAVQEHLELSRKMHKTDK